MRRRAFIAALGGTTAASLAGQAQQARRPVIAFIGVASPLIHSAALVPAFRRGLAQAGYVEGRNVTVEYGWAEGSYERLNELMLEVAARRVDVIVGAGGTSAALAAKAATSTIPVVMLAGDDPVRLGLVESINRPGGNITGVAQLVVASEGKRLEVLRELLPNAKDIAVLFNPEKANAEQQLQDLRRAGATLGLVLHVVEAAADHRLPAAIASGRRLAEAMIVAADPYLFARHDLIVRLAAEYALPAIYFFRESVIGGGLMSYGSNLSEAYREIGAYAGRILRGENPADMPVVQQSDKLELVINLKTAKALGLQVPLTLLTRADEVIE